MMRFFVVALALFGAFGILSQFNMMHETALVVANIGITWISVGSIAILVMSYKATK